MESVDPDGPLVRRAKEGDYKAFEELASRHERRLHNLAARLLRQREDAENAVQSSSPAPDSDFASLHSSLRPLR